MITITGHNAPEAYAEALWKIRVNGKSYDSRNGPVFTIETPVMLEIIDPRERLITDSTRDANPFFHCMEFIWMMAGSNDARWLAQFNKNYMNYSDDGQTVHAGYGHRWCHFFGFDQLEVAIRLLHDNFEDRRVVLQMWDARADLGQQGKDFPCNTQIIPRIIDNRLDFLVTNRSNDLIWGMLGANVVHMTMLQELMAQAIGCEIGKYRVISNNLHMYKNMPRFSEIWHSLPTEDIYVDGMDYFPLLSGDETYMDFANDCEGLMGGQEEFRTKWMREVGHPIYWLWFHREWNEENIKALDWRIACTKWLLRGSRGSSRPSDFGASGESATKTPEDGQ